MKGVSVGFCCFRKLLSQLSVQAFHHVQGKTKRIAWISTWCDTVPGFGVKCRSEGLTLKSLNDSKII